MALPLNLPFKKAIPLLKSQLTQRAANVHDRGMHSAAESMRDAAKMLEQLYALHIGLCEREAKLTAEIVALRP